MDRPDFQEEIRELNLAYLMLAQQMLRDDRATALFRLGIGEAFADIAPRALPQDVSRAA